MPPAAPSVPELLTVSVDPPLAENRLAGTGDDASCADGHRLCAGVVSTMPSLAPVMSAPPVVVTAMAPGVGDGIHAIISLTRLPPTVMVWLPVVVSVVMPSPPTAVIAPLVTDNAPVVPLARCRHRP